MIAKRAFLSYFLPKMLQTVVRAFVLLVVVYGAQVSELQANDIRLSNTRLQNKDTTLGVVQVSFDLAWNNSWRLPPDYHLPIGMPPGFLSNSRLEDKIINRVRVPPAAAQPLL